MATADRIAKPELEGWYVKDSLTEAAKRFAADMLAIGRSPQSGALGRIRDLTYVVVRDAPCPVLSV